MRHGVVKVVANPLRGQWLLVAVVCSSLGTNALGAPPRTYQGRPLTVWLNAMSYDLDSEYRRAARDSVVHFGAAALPSLTDILTRNEEPEQVTLATGALIRIGAAGRAIVGERLANGLLSSDPRLRASLFPMILGIGDAGPLARSFIPHLRSLANLPEVSMLSLRVLAQIEGAPAQGSIESEQADLKASGPGVVVSLKPYDCFVMSRFGSIRFNVTLGSGAVVRNARVLFGTAASSDLVYVDATPVPSADANARTYEGVLPQPFLGATAVSYQVSVETNQGRAVTDLVVGGVAPTEEGCALIGGRAVPASSVKGPIKVLSLKP